MTKSHFILIYLNFVVWIIGRIVWRLDVSPLSRSDSLPSCSEPLQCDAGVTVELYDQLVATADDLGWDGAATFLDQLGPRSIQYLSMK